MNIADLVTALANEDHDIGAEIVVRLDGERYDIIGIDRPDPNGPIDIIAER